MLLRHLNEWFIFQFFRLMKETFPRKKEEFFELLWLVMDQNDKAKTFNLTLFLKTFRQIL